MFVSTRKKIAVKIVVAEYCCLCTDRLPGINLSRHCGFVPNKDYPGLFKCTKIEQDIKLCQDNGKKVTISLGGSIGDGTLGTSERALKLANNVWNLFLGGKKASFEDLRPFGRLVLQEDTIDNCENK